jgi:hypothetical protein
MIDAAVNKYAFRYNPRDDAQAMFDAVATRTKRVRSGRHGEYSPVGESGHPEALGS